MRLGDVMSGRTMDDLVSATTAASPLGVSTLAGFRRESALLFQPADDVVLAGAEPAGRVEWGALGIVGLPVELGAGGQEPFGGASLSRAAGVPERLGHFLPGRVGRVEQLLEAVEHAQRGRVPQLV